MEYATLSHHASYETFYDRPTAATRERLFKALVLSILGELLSQESVPLVELVNVTVFSIDDPINGRFRELAYKGQTLGRYEFSEGFDKKDGYFAKMLFTPSGWPQHQLRSVDKSNSFLPRVIPFDETPLK